MDRQSHGQEGSLTGRQQAGSQPGQAGREAATWTGRKAGIHMDRQEDRQSHTDRKLAGSRQTNRTMIYSSRPQPER